MVPRRRTDKIGGTRLFCPASRRESLPLATIWSFYLHLAGEPKNHRVAGGRDFNRRVWVVLRPRRRDIYTGVGGFPPQTPPSAHAGKTG